MNLKTTYGPLNAAIGIALAGALLIAGPTSCASEPDLEGNIDPALTAPAPTEAPETTTPLEPAERVGNATQTQPEPAPTEDEVLELSTREIVEFLSLSTMPEMLEVCASYYDLREMGYSAIELAGMFGPQMDESAESWQWANPDITGTTLTLETYLWCDEQ